MSSIEDRLAIEDLFTRYVTALDAGEAETVVDCFTDDAVLLGGRLTLGQQPGIYEGRDAIRTFATRFAAYREDGAQLRHMVTNVAVRLQGEEALVTAYLVTILTRGGRKELSVPGHYVCRTVKRAGDWKFSRREVAMDSPVKLGM